MRCLNVLILLFSLMSMIDNGAANAHNITQILQAHPEFSTFNHYLTLTHLASEINSRLTITVCAVDNAGMSSLLSKHLPIYTIKNVLTLHILLDYYGTKKLHQITNGTSLAASMFQETGSASGTSGFVNITDLKDGKVGFGAEDNDGKLGATFVKSLKEIPYNISVIQISSILTSPEAEAPTPGPSQLNLTELMAKKGCKAFADLLSANGALKVYEDNSDGGLTVFCPIDQVVKDFMPKYKNLTAGGKSSLLLYHGVPIYQSMQMMKSNNGGLNTLATDGAKKFDFTVQNDGEVVTLKTKIVTAKITGTVLDEQPVAIYTINKVLLPKELFKAALTPAPAPAPEADAPVAPDSEAAPNLTPDGEPADTKADDSKGSVLIRSNGGKWVSVILGVWLVSLLVV